MKALQLMHIMHVRALLFYFVCALLRVRVHFDKETNGKENQNARVKLKFLKKLS
jgi:hypothetical protein